MRKIATDARSLKGIKDLACTLCNVSKTKQKLPMINKNQVLLQIPELHGYNNHFKMYKMFQVSLSYNVFVNYCPVYTIFSNNSVCLFHLGVKSINILELISLNLIGQKEGHCNLGQTAKF